MPAPESASRYYRRQERLRYATLAAVAAAWRRMEPTGRWEQQYREDVGPKVAALVAASQIAATTEANAYTPAVLTELGIDPDGPSVPRGAIAGFAGDGRPVETLLEQSVVVAGTKLSRLRAEAEAPVAVEGGLRVIPASRLFDPRQAAREALASAEQWVLMIAGTVLSDTARAAESAAIASRPQVGGYVRMLNPPSCSRCAILAGRFYRWNSGFLRHPHCDCRHIPVNEVDSGDLRINPNLYFDSLTPAEQDKIFTNSGAQAIRDGADIGQVVNARKGMTWAGQTRTAINEQGRVVNLSRRVAQRTDIGSGSVFLSTTGTTRRGSAYRGRTGRNLSARIMPESIYEVAADRDDAIRLLKLHGFIT